MCELFSFILSAIYDPVACTVIIEMVYKVKAYLMFIPLIGLLSSACVGLHAFGDSEVANNL